jgi:alpha-1,6-mannosyltransferase
MTSIHLTNAYHPASGGIRTAYLALLDAANRERRKVRLIVPAAEHRVDAVGDYGRIYHIKAPRAFAFDRRYRLLPPTRYLVPGMDRITAILRREQPDIVEICDKLSLFYIAGLIRKGWMRGVRRPLLIGLSAERFADSVGAFLSRGKAFARLGDGYMRYLYAPMFDYHIANSEYTAAELRAVLAPHRQRVVHVNPPGVDLDWFAATRRQPEVRARLMQALNGGSATALMLFAGRLSPEKNAGVLVDVMARLSRGPAHGDFDVRLIVAGDGPARATLEARAASECPGRVLFVGNVASRDAYRDMLGAVDLMVHPNPREPFGIAPLEAMAAGVPVVVPNAGGVLTYASEETAWLATPDAAGMARTIRMALRHRPLTDLRTARARERARAFAFPAVMSRTFALYDQLRADFVTQGRAAASPAAMMPAERPL